MCTAVDGGSIHRAARRISAASDQTSTTPITSHRTKDRRKPLRSGVLGGVSGFSVTLQNTSLGSVAAHMPDPTREHGGLRSAQATRAEAPWSRMTDPAANTKWD